MNKLVAGAVGVASGVVIVIAWSRWPGAEAFKVKVLSATSLTGEAEQSPLAPVEHYHWGLALTLPGNPVLTGVGASLIASEAFEENPFGIGKSEWEVKGNILLTSVLVSLIAIKYGYGHGSGSGSGSGGRGGK